MNYWISTGFGPGQNSFWLPRRGGHQFSQFPHQGTLVSSRGGGAKSIRTQTVVDAAPEIAEESRGMAGSMGKAAN